jgi:hypothetical protein
MNLRSLSLAALSMLVLAASPAFADDGHARGREACKGDVERFCKDVKPGGGRIMECLKQHEAELSPQCKAVGEQMKAKMEAMKAACGVDAQKYCSEIPKGPPQFICLKSNQDRVSATCKAELDKHPMKDWHGKGRHHRGHAG